MYNEICKNAGQVYTMRRFSQDPWISINLQLYEKYVKNVQQFEDFGRKGF